MVSVTGPAQVLFGQNIIDNLNQENADFDSNDKGDGNDYLIWQGGFETVGTAMLSTGDANGDMAVTDEDRFIWLVPRKDRFWNDHRREVLDALMAQLLRIWSCSCARCQEDAATETVARESAAG